MKKLILPIVLILGISMLLGFVSALENCSDSDDGANYFSKGLVIPRAGDEQFYDSCKTSKILLEGTCDEQGGKVYEYVCPGTCSDGACVCSDSDNGRNYNTKGLVIARAGDEQVWDSCKTDYILLEGTCDEQGGAAYEYQCPNGCSNGACIGDSTSCSDTDTGLDYSAKGVLSVGGNTYTDTCTDSNFVKEYFCDNPPSYYDNYYCPNGCSNGACITQIISQCKDSDGGKNPNILGKAETQARGQGDWCDYGKGENKIYEAYCINQTDFAIELMNCPTDQPYCNKGKCTASKPQCSEDDGGKNPLVLGTTFPSRIADHTGATDYCQITSTGQPPENGECSGSDCSLREFFCVDGSPDEFYNDIPCSSGCKNGVCSKIEPTEETGPIDIVEETEETGPIDLPENIPEEDTSSVCSGCALDKKCYPYGFRKDGNFCSDKDSNFINQNKPEVSCENSFECDSNLCIDNKCVSGSLWQKIMNWFSKLFGGK